MDGWVGGRVGGRDGGMDDLLSPPRVSHHVHRAGPVCLHLFTIQEVFVHAAVRLLTSHNNPVIVVTSSRLRLFPLN